ncbi:MAG: GNAT family N-acetyltransferase [Chloroflexi bacterium]|nr:GNAT family N-acetyltransferase [Chloroflexota bacterium]
MLKNEFPQMMSLSGAQFRFRLMTVSDRGAILVFAQNLSESDQLFMRRDITQPEAIDAWLSDIEARRAITIMVEDEGKLIGYGTLYFNQLFWNRHLGEIRLLVSSPYRNWGIEARLVRELLRFADELALEKVVTYMAVEDKAARTNLESLGFRAEAILADWVKTRDDRTHDLLIMGLTLQELH